jgi:hypothetical protein
LFAARKRVRKAVRESEKNSERDRGKKKNSIEKKIIRASPI